MDATGARRRALGAGNYLNADVNLSWHLVWLFAILEGITVPLLSLFSQDGPRVGRAARTATGAEQLVAFANKMFIIGIYGLVIGFVGASVVCLLLNWIVFPRVTVRLNDAAIVRVLHPFIVGMWGGVLLAVIFWIQLCIAGFLTFPMVVNLMLFGFVSAAGSIMLTGSAYCFSIKARASLGVQLITARQRLLLCNMPVVSFAVLVGIYEGLAAPILQRWELAPHHKVLAALLMGVLGGAFSSAIVVALAHIDAIKKHMWLRFAVMDQRGNLRQTPGA
ncbi:hypothetical protein [Mycobacterium sp. 852002-51971_SCH5477799-a]|uniref:hypothetical protein n=1 Tax=Mycobacterium sp. 852002-51971_SCH5477799-a TaxID=1834106 RepID=UPI000A7DBE1A|nr:hypothetical protein [Mycobacterium sp. 852002-51971_SCH5477799-a]